MLLLSPQLHRLCWSLRNSQEKREDLDAGMQRKRLGFTLRTQPGEKEEPRRSCLAFSGVSVACAAAPAPSAPPSPLPEMLFQAEALSFIFHKMLLEVFGAC